MKALETVPTGAGGAEKGVCTGGAEKGVCSGGAEKDNGGTRVPGRTVRIEMVLGVASNSL